MVEATNLAELYGLPVLDRDRVEARSEEGLTQAPGNGGPDRHTYWLTTINENGSPHVTGIDALWIDGAFWFETGERTRKGRNLARDPRSTLSVATHGFDLIVEGVARKVTDPATVAALAARWSADGWPARVDDTGTSLTAEFSAWSAGLRLGASTVSPRSGRHQWKRSHPAAQHAGPSRTDNETVVGPRRRRTPSS